MFRHSIYAQGRPDDRHFKTGQYRGDFQRDLRDWRYRFCSATNASNSSAAELRETCPTGENCAMLIATTMENIGVMMYQRIVPYAVS